MLVSPDYDRDDSENGSWERRFAVQDYAQQLLATAPVYDTLREALADCQISCADQALQAVNETWVSGKQMKVEKTKEDGAPAAGGGGAAYGGAAYGGYGAYGAAY